MSRLIPLRPALVIVVGIGLGGCLSPDQRHGSTPGRRPAMPTVALAPANVSASVSDSDVATAAMEAARRGDSDGVVRALQAIGDSSRRAEVANRIRTQLAGHEPKFMAKLALELARTFQLTGGIEAAGRLVAQQDPEYALGWAAELPAGAASRHMARAIVVELVRRDPRATLDRINALPPATREEMLMLAAAAWARDDAEAAIAWLRGLPEDDVRRRLTSSVGFAVAQTRPNRAIEVAEMLPEGRDRWLLLSAIAQTWVAVDAEDAVAWSRRLPAGEARDAALAGIDTGLGVPTSRRIASAPGVRGGGGRTRGGTAAVGAWPDVNSPDFAAWLATQRPGMSREEAILEYVRQRGALEPAAIGPLIASLPPGYTRDEATQVYLDGLLIGSPREAARWVRSLPRSERTDELIEKTARRYLQTNPDAAAQWLQDSTLPPDRKEQLLREAGR